MTTFEGNMKASAQKEEKLVSGDLAKMFPAGMYVCMYVCMWMVHMLSWQSSKLLIGWRAHPPVHTR
jgi:hypothetical protein